MKRSYDSDEIEKRKEILRYNERRRHGDNVESSCVSKTNLGLSLFKWKQKCLLIIIGITN